MAFTEFYIQSGGSNLNAGSTNNNTATYTSAAGNWVNGTRVFTPTDGQTTTSLVSVGDFASVYVTAGATATAFIGRVTVVGAGVNGTITISATISYGTNPSDGTGTITLRTGGAWAGPGASVTFPFALSGNSFGTLLNTSSNFPCLNVKNDQTYTMTSVLPFTAVGKAIIQGYSSTVRDGGRATFTSNVTAQDDFQVIGGNGATSFIDLIFASTAGSGTSSVFAIGTVQSGYFFLRCVFHGGRLNGFQNTSSWIRMHECEAYDNNKAANTDSGGFETANSTFPNSMFMYRCYSHDNTGTGGHGFYGQAAGMILDSCISESNGGKGYKFDSTNASSGTDILNCDFYNNGSDAITYSNGASGIFMVIENTNFLKNTSKGINVTTTGQPGIIYNNGRGSGTQANGSADALSGVIDTSTDITYGSNLTPWVDPANGNFKINLDAAVGTGRGAFTETDGLNAGTVGYPDIGAAQSLCSSSGMGGLFFI